MAKLHIFNPEHDLALASGLSNFTAPHAGRQLRHDLGFLPALWAEAGDQVLVDDVDLARRQWHRLAPRAVSLRQTSTLLTVNPEFTVSKPGVYLGGISEVDPWGWDSALCAVLVRRGVSSDLLPTDGHLLAIRQLSHRREAAQLLSALRMDGTVGEALECKSMEQVADLQARHGSIVLKAPWSSSGRGLRFVTSAEQLRDKYIDGWFHNLLSQQGSVMAEPYYNKVKDFGMEFSSDGKGRVSYLGLSLFDTSSGAYVGNILASDQMKQEIINRYIPEGLLKDVQQKICSVLGEVYRDKYRGSFGVDMMVVASPTGTGFLLHPCVEINLRRTMGHVALSLSPQEGEQLRVMRITYENFNYKLRIRRL